MEEFYCLCSTKSFDDRLLIKMDKSSSLFWSREIFSEIEIIFMIIKNEISSLTFVLRLIDIGRTVGIETVEIQEN